MSTVAQPPPPEVFSEESPFSAGDPLQVSPSHQIRLYSPDSPRKRPPADGRKTRPIAPATHPAKPAPSQAGDQDALDQAEAELLDFRPESPFRPPDWRWKLVQAYTLLKRQPPRRHRQPRVMEALRLNKAVARCRSDQARERLYRQSPDFFDATEIYERGERPVRWTLEARLLAHDPYESIAQKDAMSVETISWYAEMFYDVQDRLDSPGWITNCAIGPKVHECRDEKDIGVLVRLYGYHLGPHVVDALVTTVVNAIRPESSRGVADALHADVVNTVLRKAALAVRMLPVSDPKTAVQLIRWSARLKRRERQHQQMNQAHAALPQCLEAFMAKLNESEQAAAIGWPACLAPELAESLAIGLAGAAASNRPAVGQAADIGG